MIGKVFTFITGFFVGTFFGFAILERLLEFIVERWLG